MPRTFSITFFFTDYVCDGWECHAKEFNVVDLHFYLIILELSITCGVMLVSFGWPVIP